MKLRTGVGLCSWLIELLVFCGTVSSYFYLKMGMRSESSDR